MAGVFASGYYAVMAARTKAGYASVIENSTKPCCCIVTVIALCVCLKMGWMLSCSRYTIVTTGACSAD
jgi:hypothetical protein